MSSRRLPNPDNPRLWPLGIAVMILLLFAAALMVHDNEFEFKSSAEMPAVATPTDDASLPQAETNGASGPVVQEATTNVVKARIHPTFNDKVD